MTRASVKTLLLDPKNPRLPQEVQGSSQKDLFQFLHKRGVLDELVSSMRDNGFFEHEPLITLKPDKAGRRTVLEGNRRLAALMWLHGLDASAGVQLLEQPSQGEIARLREVPVFDVDDRKDVRLFLGYRHISGMKPWPAEAKARYIAEEVEAAAKKRGVDPFKTVAKKIGSNALGIRNAYIAYALLRHANDYCRADITHVLNRRFGVWIRGMNSPEIREYIGLGDPKKYAEIKRELDSVRCEHLTEVIGDLTPRASGEKAVLQDSRDVTDYGKTLLDPHAHTLLRKYADLQIARQALKKSNLAQRADYLRRQVDAFRDEVEATLEHAADDLVDAVESLFRAARFLRSAVHELEGE